MVTPGYLAQSAAGTYVRQEEHDFDQNYKLEFVQNGKWEYVRNSYSKMSKKHLLLENDRNFCAGK